jgi:hypothetical protein
MLSFCLGEIVRILYNAVTGPRFGTVPLLDFVAPQKRERWLPLWYDARSSNYTSRVLSRR